MPARNNRQTTNHDSSNPRLNEDLRHVAKTWIKIRSTGEWFSLAALEAGWTLRLNSSHFNSDVAYLTGLPNTASVLDNSAETQRVDDVAYLPGHDRICVHNGQRILNTWTRGGVTAAAGDWSLIDRTIRHLMPDAHREKFLDALACMVQRPAANIAWGLIFRGRVGTGKTLIFEGVVSRLVGLGNYKRLEGDIIASKFTAEVGDVQFLYLNEVVRPNDRQVANRLKPFITEENFNGEAKGKDTRPMRSPSFVGISSQHHRPFPLDNPERRWLTPPFVNQPLDPVLGKALKQSLDAQSAAFKSYLLDRDISSFDPGEEMLGGSYDDSAAGEPQQDDDSQVKAVLATIVADMAGCELVLLPDLMKAVETALGWSPKTPQFVQLLSGEGWTYVTKLRKGRQGGPGVWAHVNGAVWRSASHAEVHAHLLSYGVLSQ